MATRNGEKYIHAQLESILRQLRPDDGTVKIIEAFGDARIRLFGNNALNPFLNFENALKRATGDIVVLSDQDDIWLDNKIALLREKFRLMTDSVHLVVLNGEIIDEHEKVIGESIFEKLHSGRGVLKNIYDNTYLGCCLAFSRKLLDIALPFPKRIPMHDMWLGLLAELFGTVEFVDEKTIRYRKHAASFTDFKIKFQPFTQIRRRFFLTSHLVLRFIERKWSTPTRE